MLNVLNELKTAELPFNMRPDGDTVQQQQDSLIKTCVCSKKHTQHLRIKPKWLQTHGGYLNLYYFSPCESLVRAG